MKTDIKKETFKLTWNLGLLYKNPKDPQIERDMQEFEIVCEKFAKKWNTKKLDVNNTQTLLRAISDYEKLLHITETAKPLVYISLAKDLSRSDIKLQSQLVQLEQRYTVAMNKTIFFELALGNIIPATRKVILDNDIYKPYRYFLKHIWREAEYRRSDEVEQILSLKSAPAYMQWVHGTEKLISSRTVTWRGKQIPLHGAVGIMASLGDTDRQKISQLISNELKQVSYFAEAELNAVVMNKKIDDDIRGFKHPYSATILEYENEEKSVMDLMTQVNTSQHIAHRFFKIKAKLMDKRKLSYADLGVSLSIKKQRYTWESAVDITRRAFEKVDPQYAEIFNTYIKNGQIDVYPRIGKAGGGYCHGGHGRPTYILLNWADELRSLTILAHEMGHGVHAELSKTQNVFHEKHPISIAEVASTLFENFVFDEIVDGLSFEEQIYARFNKLQEVMGSVFRQGAYINYELEIHKQIHEKGSISADNFAEIMQTQLQKHVGPAFNITRDDGYLWVRYMHARWFFYSYSYVYGTLISTVLYKKYKQDKTFITKINQFLSAGGSDTPENIFKSIGIDTSKSEFWKIGLQAIHDEVIELEKMIKKLNK